MKIIVGLGNPGRDYAATRHNIGFMVVDEIARRLAAGEHRSRFRAALTEAFDENEKIVLVKPQTYMNLSGSSVREATRWYKTSTAEVLVVADDIDLPFGVLRLRAGGGSGGHNGLKSIFSELATQEIPRLRIGVGRGSGHATRQVLTRFSPEEQRMLPEIVRAAADCVQDWSRHGIIEAMNRCNRRLETDSVTESKSPSRRADITVQASAQPALNQSESSAAPTRSRVAGAYNRVRSWWTGQSVGAGEERID